MGKNFYVGENLKTHKSFSINRSDRNIPGHNNNCLLIGKYSSDIIATMAGEINELKGDSANEIYIIDESEMLEDIYGKDADIHTYKGSRGRSAHVNPFSVDVDTNDYKKLLLLARPISMMTTEVSKTGNTLIESRIKDIILNAMGSNEQSIDIIEEAKRSNSKDLAKMLTDIKYAHKRYISDSQSPINNSRINLYKFEGIDDDEKRLIKLMLLDKLFEHAIANSNEGKKIWIYVVNLQDVFDSPMLNEYISKAYEGGFIFSGGLNKLRYSDNWLKSIKSYDIQFLYELTGYDRELIAKMHGFTKENKRSITNPNKKACGTYIEGRKVIPFRE